MMNICRILLTISALAYGFTPALVDLGDGHIFNDLWAPHARFHGVWLLSTLAAMGAWVLILCWHKSGRAVDRLRTASVLGLIALGTFFVATFAMGAYGGSLSDEVGEGLILGLNGNVVVFAIALVIQAGAAVIAWTQLGEDQQ
ncbi:MAG: hypothetical protein HN793_11095 [Rhodospirillaceae bacterium]|jgi:ABC-type Co2+ transport system permease subunit|nr:hypothetical protein [Rhodospirillaceae bacterium]MBT5241800.1 hypothetical protein [Rhodospirillaceae bacterium]MBT5565206.1 hypothetical protein [Rhodospirillaceae bacterium]MBT6088043.1 hypothetical protein [Rhodospirillaceae bacterium]MBT6961298.1 hypothetical protein [Rhodospirillaceae bacterium]